MVVEEGKAFKPSPKPEACTSQGMDPELSRMTGVEENPVDIIVGGVERAQADRVLRKLHLHLLPKFFTLTVLCYIDRCDG